jgi:putative transposase
VRDVDAGGTWAEVTRRHGISKETLRRWRVKYRGLELAEAKRLKALEDENRRLKKLVADLSRQRPAQRRGGTNVVTAEQRRCVVTWLRERRHVAITRACRLVGISRASCCYVSRRREPDAPVRAALRSAAMAHPRWGAPRLHWLLQRDGVVQNHKRTERLYRDEGLGVRRRRRKRLPAGPRVIRPAPARPHERWSIEFVHDRLATGRAIRVLTVVDDCTRECPILVCEFDARRAAASESSPANSARLACPLLVPTTVPTPAPFPAFSRRAIPLSPWEAPYLRHPSPLS